ncbi:MAG: hypothetical protein KA318_07490, partial [Nitrosomonas sp.]|nr:hypothetical protein [Nitrosomonas sp.]
NVFEVADTRQKQAKKRSLCVINEHFEPVFNTVAATQIVFQRPVKATWDRFQVAFSTICKRLPRQMSYLFVPTRSILSFVQVVLSIFNLQ